MIFGQERFIAQAFSDMADMYQGKRKIRRRILNFATVGILVIPYYLRKNIVFINE